MLISLLLGKGNNRHNPQIGFKVKKNEQFLQEHLVLLHSLFSSPFVSLSCQSSFICVPLSLYLCVR